MLQPWQAASASAAAAAADPTGLLLAVLLLLVFGVSTAFVLDHMDNLLAVFPALMLQVSNPAFREQSRSFRHIS